jgi:hypothetical protein
MLITTVFASNEDLSPVSQQDPESGPKREQEAVYLLIYNDLGDVSPDAGPPEEPQKQNWISMKILSNSRGVRAGTEVFIPSSIFDVRPAAAKFDGGDTPPSAGFAGTRNPHVTSKRLKVLGITKRF